MDEQRIITYAHIRIYLNLFIYLVVQLKFYQKKTILQCMFLYEGDG